MMIICAQSLEYKREFLEVNMVARFIIGVILILLTGGLIYLILKQTGKDKSLSSTLSGSSDTYFGRSGGNKKDRIYFRLTVVGSILFVVLSVVLTILVSSGT